MSEDVAEPDGGEGGGTKLILSRSELAVLRRMASKYPIVDGERQDCVDLVMEIVRGNYQPSHKVAAVKALIAMDRLNHDELKLYIEAVTTPQVAKEVQPAQVVVNNQVVVQNKVPTVEDVLAEYGDVIARRRVRREIPPINGAGESVHPQDAPPKAG